MDLLFELIAELVFQFFVEALADLAIRRLRCDLWIVLAVVGIVAGAGMGGLTLLAYSHHIIRNSAVRYASAVFTPFLIAFAMARIGAMRDRKGYGRYSLEYFWTAWIFAFSFGAVRVLLAQ